MKRLFLLCSLLALPVALDSCANAGSKPKASLVVLAQQGIPAPTLSRIKAGRVLGFSDILILVNHHISDKAIVSYLKSTHAPYRFTTAQLEQLSSAGAGSSLVNYLGSSIGFYEATKAKQVGGNKWDNHPYFNDPAYWGEAPFDYGFPMEWDNEAILCNQSNPRR